MCFYVKICIYLKVRALIIITIIIIIIIIIVIIISRSLFEIMTRTLRISHLKLSFQEYKDITHNVGALYSFTGNAAKHPENINHTLELFISIQSRPTYYRIILYQKKIIYLGLRFCSMILIHSGSLFCFHMQKRELEDKETSEAC